MHLKQEALKTNTLDLLNMDVCMRYKVLVPEKLFKQDERKVNSSSWGFAAQMVKW